MRKRDNVSNQPKDWKALKGGKYEAEIISRPFNKNPCVRASVRSRPNFWREKKHILKICLRRREGGGRALATQSSCELWGSCWPKRKPMIAIVFIWKIWPRMLNCLVFTFFTRWYRDLKFLIPSCSPLTRNVCPIANKTRNLKGTFKLRKKTTKGTWNPKAQKNQKELCLKFERLNPIKKWH